MRRPGWEERLAALEVEARVRTFGWGTFDCVTFAAEAVEAVTGQRPTLPTWSTWREAARLVRARGGLRQAAASVLGEPLPAPGLAQRGDVVLVRTKLPALGVVVGASALVPIECGVQRVPAGDWIAAWRVE